MPDTDEALLRAAIIIIGAPRSGTTMLTHIFRQHPRLALLQEPRLVWRYGNDEKSDMLRPQDARPEVCRHIRHSFAQAVRHQGRQRLVEKTPSNALRMGFVDRVLPDCKFIHTIRNGQDSVLGIREFWTTKSHGIVPAKLRQRLHEMKWRQARHYAVELMRRTLPRRMTGPNLWGPRLPGMTGLRHDLDVLEICCLQWRMCVEAACHYGRKLPPDRYLEFRIEDLTPKLFDTMLEFCELEECDAMRQFFLQRYDPSRPGRRQREADPAELDRIRQWTEPTLHWLGYR